MNQLDDILTLTPPDYDELLLQYDQRHYPVLLLLPSYDQQNFSIYFVRRPVALSLESLFFPLLFLPLDERKLQLRLLVRCLLLFLTVFVTAILDNEDLPLFHNLL